MNFIGPFSFLGWAVVALLTRTLRIRLVNSHDPSRSAAVGMKAIYAFWHGSTFLLPATYRKSGLVVMVSESNDGEIAARILQRFGFDVIRGSSRRKGNRALIALIRSMRSGGSVAIAADGPRGPRHEAKLGVAFLAGELQVPIIPVATAVDCCWTMRHSWDRFVVPVPFSKGLVLFGEPIAVNGTLRDEVEQKRRELTAALQRLTEDAAVQVMAPRPEDRMVLRHDTSAAERTLTLFAFIRACNERFFACLKKN